MKNLINQELIYVGNLNDDSGKLKTKTYQFIAPVSDRYFISCKEAINLRIFNQKEQLMKENTTETTLDLIENEIYYFEIETLQPHTVFNFVCYPFNHKIVTPYKLNMKEPKKGSHEAKIDYIQRKGGTYLYSNVPESMPYEALNSILMQNKNLSGECFLSFEHQNKTGKSPIYLGYRLTNIEDHDIYITVTNIGYQTKGSWQGEKAWMDYYGVELYADESQFYTKPFQYENKEFTAKQWFHDYLNYDCQYQPNPIQITTYKLPAKAHLYVIGGTSQDAYQKINVHHSADIKIALNECINGNVKFIITNGKALGELCVYDDIDFINSHKAPIQNLRRYGENDDFGGRIGYSPIHGVIDNYPVWTFDDNTQEGNLPVYYQVYYADQLKEEYQPFEKITHCTYHEVYNDCWLTHLSAQLHHNYCGKDMVDLIGICNGQEILLSNYVANPTGKIWDFGNWMIEYQEYCTFVNEGNHSRTVNFYLVNGSSVFYIMKDLENHILKSGATVNVCTGEIPIYSCTIPPKTTKTLVMQFVLPANTGGSVKHYIHLK